MPPDILEFSGRWRFLSNFYPSVIPMHDHDYPTAEHAYQAAKNPSAAHRKLIALCATPGQAKRAGRAADRIPNWETHRYWVMKDILNRKFADRRLARMLQSTGIRRLVEGNTWGDTYWGVCRGKGANMLGELLMDLRREMRGIGGTVKFPTYSPRKGNS